MKRLAIWTAVAALAITGSAIAGSAGCSVSHRSGDFACQVSSDCSSDRICSDGLCVLTQQHDAGTGDLCPAQCTSCNLAQHSCTIDCASHPEQCNQRIACPSGWSCDVQCTIANSCRNGVTCAGSSPCSVTCSGDGSCRAVSCGLGPCRVDCSGTGSCRDVSCGSSCGCDVTCRTNATCSGVTCSAIGCELQPHGCSSLRNSCNTCQ